MSESFIASTQYGDLTGTVAFDGYEGGFLKEIAAKADIPKNYYPIGFRINSIQQEENDEISMSIHVIAVPCEMAGESIDAMLVYERENGELPAKRFESSLTFDELLPLMKRLSICARIKDLEAANVQIQVR